MRTLTALLAAALLATGSAAVAACAGMSPAQPDQTTAETNPILLPPRVGS